MFIFVDIVRAIATILITNSHFGPIYTFDALAKGGAFGNSLFFMISGFCLFHIKEPFKDWYLKRLIRLYIPLLLITWFHLYNGNSIGETIIFSFIFPAQYWFICALVILYPIYYFVVTHPFKYRKYVCFSILLLFYTAGYLLLDKTRFVVETAGFYGIRFSYFFEFFLMLFGGYVRKNFSNVQKALKNRTTIAAITFAISFFLYFAFIVAMRKFPVLYMVQFFETILCIATTITLISTVISLEDYLSKVQNTVVVRALRYLGSCTLEIYLVQFPIITVVGGLDIPSWSKFIVVVSVIMLCAVALKQISQYLIQNVVYRK